ncbi:MAG: response regulator, partial [Desulfovibrionaceae bacterium]|jgi:DNA-binding NtrC family response regulator
MSANKTTILLVDDEKDFLESVAERVRLKGYEVLTALNGEQALAVASENVIHLAVVDLRLPDMEGLVVITKIKEKQPDVKTILLTGYGDKKLKQATESLNSSYFEKQDMGGFWDFLKRLGTRPTVLLVDDEPDFLSTVAERMQIKGFDVATAASGEQALELAARQEFFCAVVDMKMPDMDGLVVITKLKELQPGIKTVLLTGHGSGKLREATGALNSAYFEKQDMTSFWGHLQLIGRRIERTMAAAGMATGGDVDDAGKLEGGEDL